MVLCNTKKPINSRVNITIYYIIPLKVCQIVCQIYNDIDANDSLDVNKSSRI